MVEHLDNALKSVLEKKSDIDAVVTALEKAAPTSAERQESSKSKSSNVGVTSLVLS